jgi:hypothetical protein
MFRISVESHLSWTKHWILSLTCMVPVTPSAAVHARFLIVDYCCSTLDFSVNCLLTYWLIDLQYSFTLVSKWSLLISYLRRLSHRYFNIIEILILHLILNIKRCESQSPHRRLLMSVISEAYLLLIMICSIWLNFSQSGEIQVWRWIFLSLNNSLTVTNFLQAANSQSILYYNLIFKESIFTIVGN